MNANVDIPKLFSTNEEVDKEVGKVAKQHIVFAAFLTEPMIIKIELHIDEVIIHDITIEIHYTIQVLLIYFSWV